MNALAAALGLAWVLVVAQFLRRTRPARRLDDVDAGDAWPDGRTSPATGAGQKDGTVRQRPPAGERGIAPWRDRTRNAQPGFGHHSTTPDSGPTAAPDSPSRRGSPHAGAPWQRRTPWRARIERTGGAASHSAALGGLLDRLGRALRRVARRPADTDADRRVGAAALASAALAAVAVPLAVLPAAWAVGSPVLTARRHARRREAIAVDQLPDVTDLLILTTTAGLPVSASLEAIGRRPGGPFGAGVAQAAAHVRLGGATADALTCLTDAVGPVARPLVDALTDHDRYGAPLRPTLERVAVEARARRRRQAEEEARRLPVTLLFPLVLTTLPAFFLLAIVPLLAGSLGAIRP